MALGKSITCFLENGDANGVIHMDLHGWEGNAVLLPREAVNTYKNPDVNDTGVYLLLCNPYSGDRSVYIGEAIDVQKRLIRHIFDYSTGKEQYYWDIALVFTAGASLNKGFTQYIENRLTQIATEVGNYNVLTKKTVSGTKLKPSAQSDMETFIDNICVIVRLLGFNVFSTPYAGKPANPMGKGKSSQKPSVKDAPVFDEDEEPIVESIPEISEPSSFSVQTPKEMQKLYCRDAVMHIEGNKYIVEKGSRVSAPSSFFIKTPGYYALLTELKGKGIISNNEFVVDYEFSSPSAAAAVVLGRSANGKTEWKTEGGEPLSKFLKVHDADPIQ